MTHVGATGRVALVTGAARGQGLAIVERLRPDGMVVLAGDVLVGQLHEAAAGLADPGIHPIELDVTSEDSRARAMATVSERHARHPGERRASRPGRDADEPRRPPPPATSPEPTSSPMTATCSNRCPHGRRRASS